MLEHILRRLKINLQKFLWLGTELYFEVFASNILRSSGTTRLNSKVIKYQVFSDNVHFNVKGKLKNGLSSVFFY